MTWNEGNLVVSRILDWVFQRQREDPDVPLCPDHKTPMQVRGYQGQPARFSYQTQENYTVIYFCPIPGCNQTAEGQIAMTQIPVPGAAPRRPVYARRV